MNFIKAIRKSVNSHDGKESSTRIAFYFFLFMIIIFCIVFIVLEFMGHVISNEIIIIFGSILAQQLSIWGINKNYESKIFRITSELNTKNSLNTDNTSENPVVNEIKKEIKKDDVKKEEDVNTDITKEII